MNLEWVLAGVALLSGIGAIRMMRICFRYYGSMVVTCPETRRAAGVRVNARHAALTPPGRGTALRLSTCSRWPERAGCGQECLSQIAASPEDCLVRNVLDKWYQGKVCASCGQPFGKIQWSVRKPALLSAHNVTMDWHQIPAATLYETMETSQPVCFACHMAHTLVREHPELAIERPEKWRSGGKEGSHQ
jgi:hypothetical protein